MRILHLTTEFPPLIFGGLGTSIGGLAHASAEAGAEVAVLLIGGGTASYPTEQRGGGGSAHGGNLPTRVSRVHLYATGWDDSLATAIRVCREWRPDLVHLHVFWLWHIARDLRAETGLPLLYTVHSLDVAEYQLGNGPAQCLDQWNVQQTVLAYADMVHAPSESEADLVAQYCPQASSRLGVAGHGIHDPHGRPRRVRRLEQAHPTILYVGRFVDRKGIRELLAAIPSVLDRAPQARFILAGGHRGVGADEMEQWWLPAELAPVRHQIRFTGWLNQEQTAAIYTEADILVIPSWYEPFGMVVLEGMLEGLAIAASAVGGPSEILEHDVTGLLFPARDADSIAAALADLVLDADLRQRLGHAAARRVRSHWLWPRAIMRMHALYERTINADRSAA